MNLKIHKHRFGAIMKFVVSLVKIEGHRRSIQLSPILQKSSEPSTSLPVESLPSQTPAHMAQSLRRPLSSVVGLSSSLQRRPFTQSSPQWAGLRSAKFARPAQRAEKSIKVLQKEQMAQGLMPSDMGLFQGMNPDFIFEREGWMKDEG